MTGNFQYSPSCNPTFSTLSFSATPWTTHIQDIVFFPSDSFSPFSDKWRMSPLARGFNIDHQLDLFLDSFERTETVLCVALYFEALAWTLLSTWAMMF